MKLFPLSWSCFFFHVPAFFPSFLWAVSGPRYSLCLLRFKWIASKQSVVKIKGENNTSYLLTCLGIQIQKDRPICKKLKTIYILPLLRKQTLDCWVGVQHADSTRWNLSINLLFTGCWIGWILGKISSEISRINLLNLFLSTRKTATREKDMESETSTMFHYKERQPIYNLLGKLKFT